MAPRKKAVSKAKGKRPVVVSSNDDADNILNRPVFKPNNGRRTRQPRSSFDRNIQKLLEIKQEPVSPVAESSAMAGLRDAVDENNDPAASDPAAIDPAARQLRLLENLMKDLTQLRQSTLNKAHQATVFRNVQNIDVSTKDIAGTVNDIQDALESTSAEVTSLEATIDGMNTQTDAINDTVTEVNDTVTDMQNDLQEVTGTVDEIRDSVTEVNDTVVDIKYTVDITTAQLDGLYNSMNANANSDSLQYEAIARRMDLLDDKMDILIAMFRHANHGIVSPVPSTIGGRAAGYCRHL